MYSGGDSEAPLVAIRSFRADQWHSFVENGEQHWWDGLSSEEETLGEYRMVIYRNEDGAAGDRYSAHIYLASTVIEIRTFPFDDALDSREAMLAIASGLEEARYLD